MAESKEQNKKRKREIKKKNPKASTKRRAGNPHLSGAAWGENKPTCCVYVCVCVSLAHTSNYTWKVKIVASTAGYMCVCLMRSITCHLHAWQAGSQSVGEAPGYQLPGVSPSLPLFLQAAFDCLPLHKSQPALNLKRRSSSTSTSFWRVFFSVFVFFLFNLPLHLPNLCPVLPMNSIN